MIYFRSETEYLLIKKSGVNDSGFGKIIFKYSYCELRSLRNFIRNVAYFKLVQATAISAPTFALCFIKAIFVNVTPLSFSLLNTNHYPVAGSHSHSNSNSNRPCLVW